VPTKPIKIGTNTRIDSFIPRRSSYKSRIVTAAIEVEMVST